MAGHIALALVPGLTGVGVGLVLIALGSGGVKANATSLVGSLYDEHDERRDAGFSLFYMGINIGALVGPLLTGLLQKQWGFHVGFALAAVGMAFGLAQYALGRSKLPAGDPPRPRPAAGRPARAVRRRPGRRRRARRGAVLVGVITADRLANIVIGVSCVAAIGLFAMILPTARCRAPSGSRVLRVHPAVRLQRGLLVALPAAVHRGDALRRQAARPRHLRLGDADLVGPAINPVFIIVLAGVFAALWTSSATAPSRR